MERTDGGWGGTRADMLRRVGHLAQLGGTRHYVLSDGRAQGVRAVDVETGAGLRFTVLPDRGMDISLARYRDVNLVYLTPNGEVHPAYYEPQGSGWLRTFFGGLLTTCGLTYLGAPGPDGEETLGLHGRYAASPACRVCDLSGWEGDRYVIRLSGVVEECALFGAKIRLTRTITSAIGSRSLTIEDVAQNFGYTASPFTILYHVNAGAPLLGESAELVVTAAKSEPFNEHSATAAQDMLRFSAPAAGFEEQNFLHTVTSDGTGRARAALINRRLRDGLGLYLSWDAECLPYLNEWKMLGAGEYVVGMEPSNVPCRSRAQLRREELLPSLAPGESKTIRVEIGVLDGQEQIEAFVSDCAQHAV